MRSLIQHRPLNFIHVPVECTVAFEHDGQRL